MEKNDDLVFLWSEIPCVRQWRLNQDMFLKVTRAVEKFKLTVLVVEMVINQDVHLKSGFIFSTTMMHSVYDFMLPKLDGVLEFKG